MKILIVMAGFFPGKKYGGPPVSVNNFCSLMKDEDCYIVTRNHDSGETNAYKTVESGKWIKYANCSIMYLSDEKYNINTFKVIIGELMPDLIYLQGLFQKCVIPCLKLAKKYGINVLLAPRGELCSGAFKKKYKKIPYIIFLKVFRLIDQINYQSTSEEETKAIKKQLGAKDDQIFYLTNIPSIPRKKYERAEKKRGNGRFVFVSRIHPKKNLIFAIQLFNFVRGNAVFDIYGPIEDEEYWKQCQDEIVKLPNNISVNYRGLLSHEEVHEVFSHYDSLLFPTFSENYGHVIAEALIVGTQVIISDQTPWNDVSTYSAGWCIPLNDTEKFVIAIQSVIDQSDSDYSDRVLEYIDNRLKLDQVREDYKAALLKIQKLRSNRGKI